MTVRRPWGGIVARPAALAAALAVAAVGACSDDGGGADGEAATTTTTIQRSTAEEVPLEVGQCGDVEGLRVGGPVDPGALRTLPCDQPHQVEVAAVFDHPAEAGADFPGTDAVDGYATDQCLQRFADYVGTPYETSTLDVAFVAPGEDGWDDGDRRIACVVYHVDFVPLIGSVEGLAI